MAGAVSREVARCGGGHISWQVQYFVRVGGVDVQIFVAAQGLVRLRVVVEVNVAVTLGLACEPVLLGGAGIAKLLELTLVLET